MLLCQLLGRFVLAALLGYQMLQYPNVTEPKVHCKTM